MDPRSQEPSDGSIAPAARPASSAALPEPAVPATTGGAAPSIGAPAGLRSTLARGAERLDGFFAAPFQADPEQGRKSRLVVRFGLLGFCFGALYAGFYLGIGHNWGALIIVLCSLGFLGMPFVLRATQSLALPGNGLVGIMTAGFTALCAIEGGMDGHAIAWLVSVPLCALLLTGRRAAAVWFGLALAAAVAVVAAPLAGWPLRALYPTDWHTFVTAAGYLGLIVFMFLLGVIFERGRARALRRMQDALRQLEVSNEKLVHLNNEKNEFLGIAAHDLKNPLTVIIGTAELLPMAGTPDQVGRMADRIAGAGTRMRDLINTLLDANAIEEGRYSSTIERCDLADLARQSIEHNQPNAARKQITVRLEPGAEGQARADRSALVQVLDNLVSNAIKYSPPGSAATLLAGVRGGQVFIAVRDQGPGLTPDDQKKLFRKFTRLSAKPTGGESSTGLGLSIVKRLVESMSGTITCESTPGQGATFTVTLPPWADTPSAPASDPASNSTSATDLPKAA